MNKMMSNTACGVAHCSNCRQNAPNAGFFCLPSIVATDKRTEELSRDRKSQWLSKINRKNLTTCEVAETQHYMFVGSISLMGNHQVYMKPQILTGFQQ